MAGSNRDILNAAVSGILASIASASSSQTATSSPAQNNPVNNEESVQISSPAMPVGQALGQLFPQCGQRSSQSTPVRRSESTLRSFSSGNKRKRKVKQEKEYSFAKDIVLKDVVLLPSPEYKKVPRGKAREMLYAEGFVTAAVEVHGNWSESDAVKALEEQFKEKLMHIPPPRFEFVRAIGSTIIKPPIRSDQGWTGKVIKHQTGQGPLYIRATRDINVLEIDSEEDEHSSNEKDVKSYFIVKNNVSAESPASSSEDFTQPITSKDVISTEKAAFIETLKSMFPYHDEEKYNAVAIGSSTLNEAIDKMIDSQSEGFFCNEPAFMPDAESNDGVDHPNDYIPTTLEDVLLQLEPHKDGRNRISISRDTVLEDSIAIFKNTGFDMSKPCKVVFEGEPAIDGGGPKREFFTLLLASLLSPNIPVRLFEGQSGRILPIHNADALRAHLFKVAGKMIASSIVNGCSGFPYFSPAAYTYLVTNSFEKVLEIISVEDVPDTEVLDIINQIDNLSDASEVDTNVTNCLIDAGFTKALTPEHKGEAIMSILLHTVILSRKAELDQFADGLGPLLSTIRKYPEICKPLLVQSVENTRVTGEKLKSLLMFEEVSDHMKKHLMDYIEMKDEKHLSDFLMFCTGTPTIPPLGFHKPNKIAVYEIESSLPNVNTCPMIIELPSKVSGFGEFCQAIDTAISCQCHGFGIL